MKVLLLAPNIKYPGSTGGSVHLMELSKALSKKCDLKVLCGCKKDFEENGVEFYSTKSGRFSLLSVFKIWNLAKDVDIIHSRADPFELGGLLVAKLLNKPVVGEVNMNFLYYEKKKFIRNLFYPFIQLMKLAWIKWFVGKMDKVICVSNVLRKILIGRGIDGEKIEVVPNGGNPERFKFITKKEKKRLRKRLNLPDDFIVLSMGTLGPASGIHKIINIKIEEICFLIIGGKKKFGGYIDNLKKIAGDNFIFKNPKSYNRIGDYIQASDALIAPYMESGRESRAGCPIKVLEGMAAGLPVIATDLPWIREILTEKEGILTSDFERAIKKLHGDKKLRERLGKKAREKIKKKLSWDHAAQKLVKIYKSLK